MHSFSGRKAPQDEAELMAFIKLLQQESVGTYGEIGCKEGDTFHNVMSSLPKGSTGVALDLPSRKYGYGTEPFLRKSVSDLVKLGYKTSLVIGDSRAPDTIRKFRLGGPYDAIFIDANHTLPYVTADWENYRGMARIVGFHDIVGPRSTAKNPDRVQVHLLWAEIKRSHKVQEFVTTGSGMGIGVVWMQ